MKPLHSEVYRGLTINVYPDMDAVNPRKEFECMGTIYHVHKKYDLGQRLEPDRIQDLMNYKHIFYLPVYMYEHGGVALSTSDFGDRWDSGQVGVIVVDKQEAAKLLGNDLSEDELRSKALEVLKSEIKVFSQYLNGEVYGYQINGAPKACDSCGHEKDNVVDSCFGHYGLDCCLEEARSFIDFYEKQGLEGDNENE